MEEENVFGVKFFLTGMRLIVEGIIGFSGGLVDAEAKK